MAEINKRILILGKSGSGKSWLARYLTIKMLSKVQYCVILDNSSNHFYSGLKDHRFKLLPFLSEYTRREFDWITLIGENRRLVIEFTDLVASEVQVTLNDICRALNRLTQVLLLIDEAHYFFPRYGFAIELDRYIRGGRKMGNDIMMVTQMAIDLNLDMLKQANWLFSFQLTEINELKKLYPYLGNQAYTELPKLGTGEYFAKNLESGKIYKEGTFGLGDINEER